MKKVEGETREFGILERKKSLFPLKQTAKLLLLIFFLVILYLVINDHNKYNSRIKSFTGLTWGEILEIRNEYPEMRIVKIVTLKYAVKDSIYILKEDLAKGIVSHFFLKESDSLAIYYNIQNPIEATAIRKRDYYEWYILSFLIIVIVCFELFKHRMELKKEWKQFKFG